MFLGCIADDLTGATDLALMLTSEGLRTVLATVVPPADTDVAHVDAIVIALKSRSIPADAAVAASIDAARGLRALGAERFFFKYCSTFDSTDAGNIGPVAEALLEFVGGGVTIACPAFPRMGRTVYMGHLFVNDALLNESGMKDHPLNPMRDSDLRRVLARQTATTIGSVLFDDVNAGVERISAALVREGKANRQICIIDAITDQNLRDIGTATAELPLITGGSGIAIGLPAAYASLGLVGVLSTPPSMLAAPAGREAILSGSCSQATCQQIEIAESAGIPVFKINVSQLPDGGETLSAICQWAEQQPRTAPILVYSSANSNAVAEIQARVGREAASRMVEELLAATAVGLRERGFSRFIIAGGETSGAVIEALGATTLCIGPEIDPGVPWTRATVGPSVALALKSGNFGSPDFFLKAWKLLS